MPAACAARVIEISRKVFTKNWNFLAANPQYRGALECLDVGATSRTPQERSAQHRTGALSKKGHDLNSAIVKKYGRYLRPSLYQHIGPLSSAEDLEVEKGLALELRRKGDAVWTN
ncbi:MAG: ribose-5-phosphate isomerase [Flavobacteriales bacterium]|nr:ribose-5-phosphate isomerase [Flavobacteriales bacterium]